MIIFGLLFLIPLSLFSCTNFLITPGATADGSTIITYAADSHEFYGFLKYIPEADHTPDETVPIIEWDTGKYLGEIPQVPHTYRVVGNMNEYQVTLGETTFGGRKELKGSGMIDYGSLMFLALQRARTAREAIGVMTDLVERYGYASEGESFSIGDPKEAWILEMIGMGKEDKRAVWVARRIPDGYISAHANQPRIHQFPLHDAENCLYHPEVIEFARKKGYFSGKDEDFSFMDAYAPLDFEALRFCDARVWCFFERAAKKSNISADYILGDLSKGPLPLWVKPDRPLTVKDVMGFMRDHFEGTPLDMTRDVGAGPYKLPYRWRPLTWKLDGKEYLNERAVATQQTGFSFVAQMRSFLPNPLGGVLWFGVDDTASTVYIPIYCGILQVPPSFAEGNGSLYDFTWESAFWVFNWVANFAYSRYSLMIEDIRRVQNQLEGTFLSRQKVVEELAQKKYQTSPYEAEEFLTRYSVGAAEKVVERWRKLGQELLVKYLDGNVKTPDRKVLHPGYPEEWYRRIVQETGDHFEVKSLKKKE